MNRRAGQRWLPTDSLRRGLLLGVGLVGFGALVHRPDVVLLGIPLLLTTVIAISQRTGRGPAVPLVRAVPVPGLVEPHGNRTLRIDVDCEPADELLAVRLPEPERPGPGRVHVLPAGRYRIRCSVRSAHWGESVVLRPDHQVSSADSLYIYGPVVGMATNQITLPPIDALPPGQLPPRPAGLVGAHRSHRPGDSTDLRVIRPFAPGDRPRHIDWRVSLRCGFPDTGVLHVRERHADADAEIIIAIDTRVDVGNEVASWSRPQTGRADSGRRVGFFRRGGTRPVPARGSLDTIIRATSALAASYLRQGDRVGLVDLGRPQLCLAPGTGAKQLLRLRHRLVLCAQSAGWAQRPVLRPQLVPAGAMVVVVSPFLDDAAAQVAISAARRGGLVIAIDVLPRPLAADPDAVFGEAALAVIRAEHQVRTEALPANGVPVINWTDRGAAAAALLRRLPLWQRHHAVRRAR